MKVLVTGAGGYLGEALCKKLAGDGIEVIALIHSKENKELGRFPNICQVKGTIEDRKFLEKNLVNVDQVYHVAAFARSWAKNPTVFYKVNVGGTINLLEACKTNNVQKIVIVSTAGTIGPAPENQSLVTENQYRTTRFFGDYEMSKIIADEKVLRYVKDGMNITTICPTRIFGPGNTDTLGSTLTKIISKYVHGKWHFKFGNRKDNANYVYIDDVVQGMILAMKNGRSGEKYIIGSFNSTMNDILSSVDEIMGRTKITFNVPFWALKTYSILISGIANLFKFDPVITPDWIEKINHNWAANINKAIVELEYQPTNKEEALRKTINWANEK
jgi:nucleoside-diphosphate-sugar epimerase